MDKPWNRFVAWFDRGQERVVTPTRVTRERAATAREFLRERSGIDFEAFRDSVRVGRLLKEPLGETAACLSSDDIASTVHSHMLESVFALDQDLVRRAVEHVSSCAVCWDNIDLYQMLEQRSLMRAYEKGLDDLPTPLWIGAVGRIEARQAAPSLAVSVITGRHRAGLSSLGPLKLRVTCPFESDEMALVQLGNQDPTAAAVVNASQPPKVGPDALVSYYRTQGITQLRAAKAGTCGFVSISQQIVGDIVHSTRVVRFEEPIY